MSPLPRSTLAVVTVGPSRTELRELPLPVIGADAGLLMVEAAGVCGADVRSYPRQLPPRVMGHENVGRIAAVGRVAAARWGVAEGDRVALEEYLPCGHCDFCRTEEFRFCLASDGDARGDALRYGSTGIDVAPGLWGGYSRYMYLHPNAILHRLPEGIPAPVASLALPLGNGFEWTSRYGAAGPGKTVAVFGPGQQGLSCVIAARASGADAVMLTGLARDQERLELGRTFGADVTVCVETEDVAEAAHAVAPGGFDVVIDTAAGSAVTVGLALRLVRKTGVVVMPASAADDLDGLPFRLITRKCVTVKGARGHSFAAVEWAIRLMERGEVPLEKMSSLQVPLSGVDRAIRGTAGALEVPVVHASVMPFLEEAEGR